MNAIRTLDAESIRGHLGRSVSLSLFLHLLFWTTTWVAMPTLSRLLGGAQALDELEPRMEIVQFHFDEITADVSAASAVDEPQETPILGAFNSEARDRVQDERDTPVPAGGELAFDNSIPGTGAETDQPGGEPQPQNPLEAAAERGRAALENPREVGATVLDALPQDTSALLTGRSQSPARPGHGAKRDARLAQEGALQFGDYSFSTLAWEYEPWAHHWRNKVENAWHPPAAFLQYGIIKRGWTLVRLVVLKDGSLSSAEVIDSDGHESLHRSSLAAVEGSAPYRALPDHFPDDQLVITARFMYWSVATSTGETRPLTDSPDNVLTGIRSSAEKGRDRFMRAGANREWRRWGGLALGIGLCMGVLACGDDVLTSLGNDTRTPPDTLRALELSTTRVDTVYSIPVSLGASPVGQVGQQIEYTAHVLYAFRLPSYKVESEDTLRLNSANISVNLDSLSEAPFEGRLSLGLREVAAEERSWSPDSILTALPTVLASSIAADSVLEGASFVGSDNTIFFDLNLPAFVDFDSVSTAGDSLEVNVALVFLGFDEGGPGFVEIPFRNSAREPTATFNAFYESPTGESTSGFNPERRVTVVEFDTTFARGTKLVASDGYRMHTYLRFEPPESVLPEGAIVHLADLILTQVEESDGTSFGAGPEIGVMVPTDSTMIFSEEQNTLALAFETTLVSLPGGQVVIPITAYILDIQEGTVQDRGMILRLSNEGTKARHFEFYGSADPDPTRRPRVRIVYGVLADFKGSTP